MPLSAIQASRVRHLSTLPRLEAAAGAIQAPATFTSTNENAPIIEASLGAPTNPVSDRIGKTRLGDSTAAPYVQREVNGGPGANADWSNLLIVGGVLALGWYVIRRSGSSY